VVEKIAFNTSHFIPLLGYRLNGGNAAPFPGGMATDTMTHSPRVNS